MMDKERVAPNLFCYQVVIGICARNGYLTQAFDLYREVIFRYCFLLITCI